MLTRHAQNTALAAKIAQLSLPLAPLVSLPSGKVHPSFPRNLLSFWLLTTEELDDMAQFYHQRTPGPWTLHYPCPIVWRKDASIEQKRMKLGRFIGLRGCESPSDPLTENEIMELVRDERERRAEEETHKAKGKWY